MVDTHFPRGQNRIHPSSPSKSVTWSENFDVTEDELDRAVKKRVAMLITTPHRAKMESRIYPSGWKKTRLVLIQKPGTAADSPSSCLPICLLDEVARRFARVIATLINQQCHGPRVGSDLSDNQFGFRHGHSTLDAIERVCILAVMDARVYDQTRTRAAGTDAEYVLTYC